MSASVLFDAPGPKARRRNLIITVIAGLLFLGALYLAYGRLDERGEWAWAKWQPLFTANAWENFLLPGLMDTLKATVIAVALSMVFGLVFGVGRLSQVALVRWLSGAVVEFFRAVPVLIMMIAFFFWLSTTGIVESTTAPFVAVVAALTLYNGAVIAELVRSGVEQLPKGQSEAGLSVGLTPSQTMRSIQLPQALTAMLPSLVSQLVVILKDSALGAIILYPELLARGRTLASGQANPLQTLVMVAIIFIVLNFTLGWLAGRLEKRINRRGKTAGTADAEAAPPVGGAAPV